MNNSFLAKALDKGGETGICVDSHKGALTTAMHFHSCCEMIHMAQGCATLSLDGVSVELKKGDTFIVPPGVIHNCACEDAGAFRLVVGVTDEVFFSPKQEHTGDAYPRALRGNELSLLFRGEEYPRIRELLGEMWERNGTGVAERLYVRGLVTLVFSKMHERWEREGLLHEGEEDSTVRKIEEYLRENAKEDLTAEGVARHFNFSYSYMAKLLSGKTGQSFTEHLAEIRVQKAKRMLLSENISVTEIGEECGFRDTSYFISCFKKATGTTPGRYRR